MINLLSVDWDYFFPNFNEFDWLEISDPYLIYDLIWPIRYATKAIGRNIIARDYYNPVWFYEHFWKYLIKTSPKSIFIFDHPEDINVVLETFLEEINIVSFDQHDNGLEKIIDIDKIVEYNLIFPRWDCKDFQVKGKLLLEFKREYPVFDAIFVYRNPKYTSSWNDGKWINFIKILKSKASDNCFLYEDKIAICRRNFDARFASIWLHEQSTYLERQRIKKINDGYIARNHNERQIRNHYFERKDRSTRY